MLEIKGYRFIDRDLITDRKTRKSIVNIYNNDNGKYCTIHHGKSFGGFDAIKIPDKANEILLKMAFDRAKLDSNYEQVKFDEIVTLTVIETLNYV